MRRVFCWLPTTVLGADWRVAGRMWLRVAYYCTEADAYFNTPNVQREPRYTLTEAGRAALKGGE